MTADQRVERAANKLQQLANQLAGEGGLRSKLAQPLAEDADLIRKMKPSLIKARARGEAPAAQPPVRAGGPVEGVRGNREVPPTGDDVVDGVRLVHRALADLLAKQGLTEIETEGKFDPHVHEALLSQPSEAEEGSVIEVVQKGYRLGDKVLRPARVVIAAAPEG